MQQLQAEHKRFFDTFGYLVLPGLFADDIGTISEEFEVTFRDRHVQHDSTKRSTIVPFIDQRLSSLLDDPRIEAILTWLLGEDWNYMGSDGNYYSGDTSWHSDGFHDTHTYAKIAFYLDPVTRDTGALRVIPGSHRVGDHWEARKAIKSRELWGIEQSQVPAIALESQPGDVVVFNHNLMHAAFGGSTQRRMFTINSCQQCQTPEQFKDLEEYVASAARFWIDHLYGERMVNNASPQRMRHLRQVLEHEAHLPALTAKARQEMAEPARG